MTYGEYLRNKNISVIGSRSANPINKTEKELAAYRAARKLGVQPENTGAAAVEYAMRVSDVSGVAFDANSG